MDMRHHDSASFCTSAASKRAEAGPPAWVPLLRSRYACTMLSRSALCAATAAAALRRASNACAALNCYCISSQRRPLRCCMSTDLLGLCSRVGPGACCPYDLVRANNYSLACTMSCQFLCPPAAQPLQQPPGIAAIISHATAYQTDAKRVNFD